MKKKKELNSILLETLRHQEYALLALIGLMSKSSFSFSVLYVYIHRDMVSRMLSLAKQTF